MLVRRLTIRVVCAFAAALGAGVSQAGNQMYEPLAASVRAAMSKAVSDGAPPRLEFDDPSTAYRWLAEMSARLERRIPDDKHRVELLKTVQYEATRAGLDPQMILGLIQVESGFKKYAVSSAGARGLMQVMPFWVNVIGERGHNLFDMRLNIRYGCVIMRHYLDIEQGNLFRALGRYNGSLGRPEYPNLVMGAWKQWQFTPTAPTAIADAQAGGNAPANRVPGAPIARGEITPARTQPATPNAGILIVPTSVDSTAQTP